MAPRPGREHPPADNLRADKRPREIRGDFPVPAFTLQVFQPLVMAGGRVVDQKVGRSERRFRRLRRRLDHAFVGHIHTGPDGPAAGIGQRLRRGRGRFAVIIPDGDGISGIGKALRDSSTDPPPRAGDDCELAFGVAGFVRHGVGTPYSDESQN